MCVCGQVMQGSTHYTHICSDVNAAATSKVSKLLITCFLVRVENGMFHSLQYCCRVAFEIFPFDACVFNSFTLCNC